MSDTDQTSSQTIEVTRFIPASPEIVFEFLVDPDEFIKWQGVEARFDPRPGGEFWLNVTNVDIASGHFVDIDPPHRVVFTWGWETGRSPLPPGASTVEITLSPNGDGTDLRLRHLNLPPSEVGHELGHRHYVARLALVASGRDPGPDSWVRPT